MELHHELLPIKLKLTILVNELDLRVVLVIKLIKLVLVKLDQHEGQELHYNLCTN